MSQATLKVAGDTMTYNSLIKCLCLPFKAHTKNKFKICTIKTFLIKLAKVRDTLANLLENGFDTVERLRCIEASTPVRAIARAENSVGVVHPFRAESR